MVYPEKVKFDLAEYGYRVMWTDLVIDALADGSISISPKQAALGTFMHDVVVDKLNVSIPPWLGQYTRSPTILSGVMAGRVSRLVQMGLSSNDMQEAIATDTVRWLMAGYPIKILSKLWSRVRIQGSDVVRKYLKDVRRHMKSS